jgi:glutathione S-transferase
MSKPTLYGMSGSRAQRSLWAAEEIGLDFEHVPVDFAQGSKTPEYLAVNPNGRIPTLVDGEITIGESMAINCYLAKTYGGDLYPQNAKDEALTWQWSVWGISEIEHLQMQIVVQKLFTPTEKRNDKIIASAEKQLARPLAVLEGALENREWLVGDAFSIADLNVSAVMLLLKMVKFDYSNFANVQRWADACYDRPSLARAQARD